MLEVGLDLKNDVLVFNALLKELVLEVGLAWSDSDNRVLLFDAIP